LVPKELVPWLLPALLFSGFLLLFLACAWTWGALVRWTAKRLADRAARTLSQPEATLLITIGAAPLGCFDPENIRYGHPEVPFTRLEVAALIDNLNDKRLVEWSMGFVALTRTGRARVLQLNEEMGHSRK